MDLAIKQKLEVYIQEHARSIEGIATGAPKSEELELIGEALNEIRRLEAEIIKYQDAYWQIKQLAIMQANIINDKEILEVIQHKFDIFSKKSGEGI